MHVIGTAGHVDHGKSSLIEALTGTHPDRLKEEREREMTIDLGFAWLTLPGGEEIGIVDVPGHRDFIENMLAGIGGIDAVIFVVAADEGIMPQTREHLAIIDLLNIQSGVIALTKIDLVDPEWMELVQDDLQLAMTGTVLENAPIVRVSSRTRQGISELLQAITVCLEDHAPRPDRGRPRLPVDRVFTITGFGTVVTGTLADGSLKVGDDIEVLPTGVKGRVRGLQTHKRKEEIAAPGSRTAVNIAGIPMEDVKRGDVIAHPGDYLPTRRFDVRCRLLPDSSLVIKHNMELKIFIGAMEVMTRVRLLGSDELSPGQSGWLQIETSSPVVGARGDRFIIRRPSPGETIGGGVVVDPHPKGRHKRFSTDVLSRLESLSQGTPAEIFLEAAQASGPAMLKDIILKSNLDPILANQVVEELATARLLLSIDRPSYNQSISEIPALNSIVVTKSFWDQLTIRILQEIHSYHQKYPLKPGIPREQLKSRLKFAPNVPPKLFVSILTHLTNSGEIEEIGHFLRQKGFQIQFSFQQEGDIKRLLTVFNENPYSTPSIKECQSLIGEDLVQALQELGILTAVNSEIVFKTEDYTVMVAEIRRLINQNGPISAAQVRDRFGTSRKYALGLLEHLDATGVTIREGDFRRLQGESKG